MYIDRLRRNTRDNGKSTSDAEDSNKRPAARAIPVSRGWRVTEPQPLKITVNATPLGPWRLPDSYKKAPTSGSAEPDNADDVLISEVPPGTRTRSVENFVVKTPHSILPSPLQFLPILFRHARLLEHAMSVLDTLNPALAARRRQLLSHCGEGFADPESAATAIAAEDKAAPPQGPAAFEPLAPAGTGVAGPRPGADPKRVRRPVPAPVNIHRPRPHWLRKKDAPHFHGG